MNKLWLGGLLLLNMPLFFYIGSWFFDDLSDCLFVFRYLGMKKFGSDLHEEFASDLWRYIKWLLWIAVCFAIFKGEWALIDYGFFNVE
jgi:hypothetical protein